MRCALATATPPGVDVASVALCGVGLLNALCAYNPNDPQLAFRRIKVCINVGEVPLADGISDTSVRLPPHKSALVPFAVITLARNLGPQLAATVVAGVGGAVPVRQGGAAGRAISSLRDTARAGLKGAQRATEDATHTVAIATE